MSLTRFQRSFYVQNDGPSRLLSRQTHTTWPKSASTIFPFPLLPSKDCFWIESSLTHSLSKAYSPSSLIPFLSQQKHRQYSRRDSRFAKTEKLNRFSFNSPIQTEPIIFLSVFSFSHSPFNFSDRSRACVRRDEQRFPLASIAILGSGSVHVFRTLRVPQLFSELAFSAFAGDKFPKLRARGGVRTRVAVRRRVAVLALARVELQCGAFLARFSAASVR